MIPAKLLDALQTKANPLRNIAEVAMSNIKEGVVLLDLSFVPDRKLWREIQSKPEPPTHPPNQPQPTTPPNKEPGREQK